MEIHHTEKESNKMPHGKESQSETEETNDTLQQSTTVSVCIKQAPARPETGSKRVKQEIKQEQDSGDFYLNKCSEESLVANFKPNVMDWAYPESYINQSVGEESQVEETPSETMIEFDNLQEGCLEHNYTFIKNIPKLQQGRPVNPAFKDLGFSLIRKVIDNKRKYFAQCSECLKFLANTSAQRLQQHRNSCEVTNKRNVKHMMAVLAKTVKTSDSTVKSDEDALDGGSSSDESEYRIVTSYYPPRKALKNLGFSLVQKIAGSNVTYYALCSNCRVVLPGISTNRLRQHRRTCQINVPRKSKNEILVDTPPLKMESLSSNLEVEKKKGDKSSPKVRGRPLSKAFERYSFALVKKQIDHKTKYFAKCLYCKLLLANTCGDRLKKHRLRCRIKNTQNENSEKEDSSLNTISKEKTPATEIAFEIEYLKDGPGPGEFFCISQTERGCTTPGRKQNTIMRELGFTLVKKVIGDKRKYYAICSNCNVPLANTAGDRLKKHRNSCLQNNDTKTLKCENEGGCLKVEYGPGGTKKVVGESSYKIEIFPEGAISDEIASILQSQCKIKAEPGRPQTKAFRDYGFTLLRRELNGTRKYYAQCWNCKSELKNTASDRLKRHRQICGTENLAQFSYDDESRVQSLYSSGQTLQPFFDPLSIFEQAENQNKIEIENLDEDPVLNENEQLLLAMDDRQNSHKFPVINGKTEDLR
ncbi:uncharacterized protein Ibf2 [Euwallacea similis]|uniref:uncharacterized protein Ibf2 n=1 Tax=Euwallacea similis TaxID=1736056 RepID=UPI00344B6263